ncbi:glycerophosphodiester phosphodiesterase family protein [Saccharothrix australiensis]|uniref:Glycerophosphoryl diester phosphodiesterase n=1 Tax=Saccharothrix australiensis TaxID=2072 RepID=A0A495W030_9PSEU|nr:glycerophosphodiester phosphodiesterase family protein [Saccharothrix australiensis]RKT54976.1 glycerophosphoryl diester phosphodiesterase [Saccharothrix australiensis]
MTANHPYLSGPHPRAFAHRGWHLDDLAGMENSLAAFRRAALEGFRYLETDVHATSDGVVVVHHDDVLDRTTDGTGPVAAQPWSAVRRANVGGREPVARLADLLEELPDALVNVDVKADGAVEPVIDLLRRTRSLHRVCLASFSERRLARLRRLGGPELMTSMGPRSAGALWASGRVPLPLPVAGRIAQVPVTQGRLVVVDGRFVRAAHRRGLEVHVWTIDDEQRMTSLLDLGVDGLVTDRPDVLRDVLRSRQAWVSG